METELPFALGFIEPDIELPMDWILKHGHIANFCLGLHRTRPRAAFSLGFMERHRAAILSSGSLKRDIQQLPFLWVL